jgi:hypothetical protein
MIDPHQITEDSMSRKRTPDQPTIEAETTTTTAVAEPLPEQNVEQRPSFVERLGDRPSRITAPDPFGIASDFAAGVRLFESRQDRLMAIKFDEKPSQDVIDKLKDSGFRWNPRDKVWVHPIRSESARTTRIEAERLYQEVRQMIRQDKGIESGMEVPF